MINVKKLSKKLVIYIYFFYKKCHKIILLGHLLSFLIIIYIRQVYVTVSYISISLGLILFSFFFFLFFFFEKMTYPTNGIKHVIFLDQKKKKKVLLAAIHYTKGFIRTFVVWITLVKDRQAVIHDRVSDLRPSFGQAGMSFFIYIILDKSPCWL